MKGDIADRVREVTADILAGLSLDLVEVTIGWENGRTVVRLALEREGGVTLDECAQASGLAGQVLDREGVFPGAYVLEVMSPGVKRLLKRPEDFTRSIGKRVKVTLRQPFEGRTDFSGILRSAGEESFGLDMGDELLELKYSSLTAARLDPELPW